MAYAEQLERVRRYHTRFREITQGTQNSSSVDECMDGIYGFFQNCYHLKDWLKNDPAYTKHTPQQIEALVTSNSALAICADLCNATKHLRLSQPPRSGSVPAFGTKNVGVQITDSLSGGDTTVTVAIHVEVNHGGKTLDAFQLATDALRAWEGFIA